MHEDLRKLLGKLRKLHGKLGKPLGKACKYDLIYAIYRIYKSVYKRNSMHLQNLRIQ